VINDDVAEVAHNEGVNAAAAAGQKNAWLNDAGPQRTCNKEQRLVRNYLMTSQIVFFSHLGQGHYEQRYVKQIHCEKGHQERRICEQKTLSEMTF